MNTFKALYVMNPNKQNLNSELYSQVQVEAECTVNPFTPEATATIAAESVRQEVNDVKT